MAEISSALAELVEKGWGAELALPLQEAGFLSYCGGVGGSSWGVGVESCAGEGNSLS